ncbi:MAG: response regulator transcription factor [Myxococcota bacterium]
MKLRILLADDHPILRTGIRTLIESTGRFEVVGEAADGVEAVALTERLVPDVLVIDIAMPRMNGLDALRALGQGGARKTRAIVLSAHCEREYVLAALRAGAAGYLAKDAAFEDLVSAIDTVAKGRRYLGQGASRRPSTRCSSRPTPAPARARPSSPSSRRASSRCYVWWPRVAPTTRSPASCT